MSTPITRYELVATRPDFTVIEVAHYVAPNDPDGAKRVAAESSTRTHWYGKGVVISVVEKRYPLRSRAAFCCIAQYRAGNPVGACIAAGHALSAVIANHGGFDRLVKLEREDATAHA